MVKSIRVVVLVLALFWFLPGSAHAKCPPGDLNGDCQVDLADLQLFAQQWLAAPYSQADLNSDEEVGVIDFAMLAEKWRKIGVPLVINEVMAANSSTILDPQGEYDDWIEIYNAAHYAINVAGMYLTDDPQQPTMWQIPTDRPAATTIPGGGYLLVWADNEVADAGLHANFQLNADGEQIGLFAADGHTLIDSILFADQAADISFGCYPDGKNELRFLGLPSPAGQNQGVYLGRVADTKFSHDRGFYDQSFEVTITCETPGALIYYTLDGTEPYQTGGRFPTGKVYFSPIPVTRTMCLRAVAIKPGWMSSNVDTQTYIFLDNVIHQPANPSGFPSVWGSESADYEMDPDIVNTNVGTLKDDLKSIPTMSLVMDSKHLFDSKDGIYSHPQSSGITWERPGSIELINPDGSKGFQANCGVRIYGGVGRREKKKTLRLMFKGIYGPTRLRYPLFGQDAADEFDCLILRSNFNDGYPFGQACSQYIRDEFCRRLQLALSHPSPHGIFVHLYVNGLYWGLYNPVERPESSFAATYFGGDKEDWDSLNSGRPVGDSTTITYNAMLNVVRQGLQTNEAYQRLQGNNPDGTPNPNYVDYLDIENYIDYMIVNFYVGNTDWPGHNWYAAFNRVNPTGWKSFSWDAEWVVGLIVGHGLDSSLNENMTGVSGSLCEPYARLRNNTEFRQLFADHVHRAFFNGGPMYVDPYNTQWNPAYPQRNRPAALYADLANSIERAMVAESARWGDVGSSTPYTVQQWRSQRDQILYTYMPQRSQIVLDQLRSASLYPAVDAPVFRVNGSYQHGGRISPTDLLSITTTSGTVYYTLDGSDPRMPGGAVNTGHATRYSTPIKLTQSTHVKARVLSGSAWSALNEATFAVGPVAENLHITEIMYHPPDEADPEEFIELNNIGSETINLNLVRFTNGVDLTFPSIELAPGKYVLVVKDQAAFYARYPDFSGVIAGQFSGSLANEGERIRLEDAVGQTILDFKYSDAWREITDGQGFSLTIVNPANPDINSWGEKDSWRASAFYGGSPGWDDTGIIPEPGSVVINEVLAHAHADASDWIELYNTTGEAINIGGWFLSDDGNDLTKYQVADGTVIAGNSYLVFYQDKHFGNAGDPNCHRVFALSENGDQVYLSSAQQGVLTGYQEVEDFDASETDVSFGRYYKGSTDNYNFVAMSENTPGKPNAYPKIGPIVINEIMYNPGSGNQNEEYIELFNISSEPVDLYRYDKSEPWRFTDGIEFVFPSEPVVTIPASGYLLVVKHLDAFAARYDAMPAGVVVVGPYDGQLQNGGEKVELSMPGDVDVFGTRYYIRIDRVSYSDGSHPEDCPGGVDLWPVEADGSGLSLSRKLASVYGNDVTNWKAAAASPGRANP